VSRPQDSRFPYLPGVDALRALAVLAVFLYHAGVGWMPGGFLGVDVFFVISGYLITSLLLREFRRDGHLRLGRFWLRRARRLLPAVGVLIALTMVVAAIVEPDRIDQLRGDAVASLLYFANWHFIYGHESYFESFQRPSLFRHLWSLSVEEQFYLFWPLLFAAGMKLFGRTRLLLGVLAGALASMALAWLLFDPGHDASRVYYGTDTHAVGLLAGVALALV
jgi:peptidoglycan/LPS O-acetylase OafA/YrhL